MTTAFSGSRRVQWIFPAASLSQRNSCSSSPFSTAGGVFPRISIGSNHPPASSHSGGRLRPELGSYYNVALCGSSVCVNCVDIFSAVACWNAVRRLNKAADNDEEEGRGVPDQTVLNWTYPNGWMASSSSSSSVGWWFGWLMRKKGPPGLGVAMESEIGRRKIMFYHNGSVCVFAGWED